MHSIQDYYYYYYYYYYIFLQIETLQLFVLTILFLDIKANRKSNENKCRQYSFQRIILDKWYIIL